MRALSIICYPLLGCLICIHHDSQAPNVSKRASRMWKALSVEERKQWEAKSEEEKERYINEKKDYKGPVSAKDHEVSLNTECTSLFELYLIYIVLFGKLYLNI